MLKNIEIIIVNDVFIDEFGCLIDCFVCDYDNIVLIYLGKNSGVYEVRFVGFKKFIVFWIGFLDVDDFVCFNMFEFMYFRGMEYVVEIVVCGFYCVILS